MPSCQYCSRHIGNEGALAQHENACDANPANQSGRELERVEPAAPPARGAGGGVGTAIADTLYVLMNFDEMPSDARREFVDQTWSIGGAALNRWFDHRERDIERNRKRAGQAQLEPIEELPVCNECAYQFATDELVGDEVRCPGCQTLYNVRVIDAAEAPA